MQKNGVKYAIWARMNNVRKWIAIKKKKILIGTILIGLVAGMSFFVERFAFESKLNSLDVKSRGSVEVKKTDLILNGFEVNQKGELVSNSENATISFPVKAQYVNTLRLDISKNIPSVSVKFVDPKSGKENEVESDLQQYMQKKNVEFSNFLIFKIQSSPEKIGIVAQNPGTMISAIKIDNTSYFNFHRFAFMFAIGLLVLFFAAFRKKIGEKPEVGFLAVALICGSLLVFSEPRYFVAWDEQIHFKHAEKLSFAVAPNMFSRPNSVPASHSALEQDEANKYVEAAYKKPKTNSSNGKPLYGQIGYLPSIAGMIISRVFFLHYVDAFSFGRWMNLFFYSVIVYFAIRKLKSGKMIMLVIALFPTALFLASNYHYDGWVNAFLFLGLAYVFSEIQQPEKKMKFWEVAIMIGSFLLALGPKNIYFPLMLFLFFIGPKKFESKKEYKKYLAAVVLAFVFVVGNFLLPYVFKGGPGKADSRGGSGLNSGAQLQFIISEPVVYGKILFNFTKDYVGIDSSKGFVTSFAYLGSIGGYFAALVVFFVAVFTDKNERDKHTSNWKMRSLIILIYFSVIALIATGLYISFTPVRSAMINGVQPRYLLPMLFPLAFLIGSARVKNPINRGIYDTIIFVVMAWVMLAGIWQLLISTYY